MSDATKSESPEKVVSHLRNLMQGRIVTEIYLNNASTTIAFESGDLKEEMFRIYCGTSGDFEITTDFLQVSGHPLSRDEIHSLNIARLYGHIGDEVIDLRYDKTSLSIILNKAELKFFINKNLTDTGVTFGDKTADPYRDNDLLFCFETDKIEVKLPGVGQFVVRAG